MPEAFASGIFLEENLSAAILSFIVSAVLIFSMSKPVAIIVILLVTIGFIVAVFGVSDGILLTS